MKYGSVTTKESYHEGKLQKTTTWHEESIAIAGKEQLITTLLDALDTLLSNETNELDLSLRRNAEGKLRLVKKHRVG